MITDIEDYFNLGCGRCERFATPNCSTKIWQSGLLKLRQLCLEAGLSEHVKWGHPCYMHAGRNIAIIGAFQGKYQLNFLNAALMKDPEGVLQKQGRNTRHAHALVYTNGPDDGVVRAYLKEAMGYAEQGIVPPKEQHDVELPQELVEVMDADPELAEGFHALTPGRKRSYAIHINSAKKAETRFARIAKFRDKILAGKGATER